MLKVLFLAANPTDTARLALDREFKAIRAKIRAAQYRDQIELLSEWAVGHDELSALLMRHRPHVVHFSGHGDESGDLVLDDAAVPGGSGRNLVPPRPSSGGKGKARVRVHRPIRFRPACRTSVATACDAAAGPAAAPSPGRSRSQAGSLFFRSGSWHRATSSGPWPTRGRGPAAAPPSAPARRRGTARRGRGAGP